MAEDFSVGWESDQASLSTPSQRKAVDTVAHRKYMKGSSGSAFTNIITTKSAVEQTDMLMCSGTVAAVENKAESGSVCMIKRGGPSGDLFSKSGQCTYVRIEGTADTDFSYISNNKPFGKWENAKLASPEQIFESERSSNKLGSVIMENDNVGGSNRMLHYDNSSGGSLQTKHVNRTMVADHFDHSNVANHGEKKGIVTMESGCGRQTGPHSFVGSSKEDIDVDEESDHTAYHDSDNTRDVVRPKSVKNFKFEQRGDFEQKRVELVQELNYLYSHGKGSGSINRESSPCNGLQSKSMPMIEDGETNKPKRGRPPKVQNCSMSVNTITIKRDTGHFFPQSCDHLSHDISKNMRLRERKGNECQGNKSDRHAVSVELEKCKPAHFGEHGTQDTKLRGAGMQKHSNAPSSRGDCSEKGMVSTKPERSLHAEASRSLNCKHNKNCVQITGGKRKLEQLINSKNDSSQDRAIKRKRGRPPRAERIALPDTRLMPLKNAGIFCESRSHPEKEISSPVLDTKSLPVNKVKNRDIEKEKHDERQKEENTGIKRTERQAVREKIMKMLVSAGWSIQYRPRSGRNYNDAVYINPDGKTHWSITLAYRVLKEYYEKSDGDSNNHSGFKFVPIPEDELSTLTKVINKVRSDKNINKTKGKEEKLHGRKLFPDDDRLKGKKKLKQFISQPVLTDSSSKTNSKQILRHRRKHYTLLVRSSMEMSASDSSRPELYNRNRSVLSWMIDLGTVPLNAKVQYMKRRKTRSFLNGKVTRDGILCDCCSKTYSVSKFEIHAGSKSQHPCKNIYLESGHSLLQRQLDSWHKHDESVHKAFHFIDTDGDDPNDDTCAICGDGGDLICCDGCPSTFHQSCLDISAFPSGLWYCIYCSCKFCREAVRDAHVGRDKARDEKLLICHMCEEKYHAHCITEKAAGDYDSNYSFCGPGCFELHERLQKFLGVKHDLDEEISWSLVCRFDVGTDLLESGMPRKVDCNSKAAVALFVMDECFLPMLDHRTDTNLIRNVVYNYGSNFNRLNYSGFLTAILEKRDEVVAAACIRIHGNLLAEMPFIGTRCMYRHQGMCRRLLGGIESLLTSLKVEKLVIPAVPELKNTWMSVFKFKPIDDSTKQLMKRMNVMVFPGVDMLDKQLQQQPVAKKTINVEVGSDMKAGDAKERLTNNATSVTPVDTGLDELSLKGSPGTEPRALRDGLTMATVGIESDSVPTGHSSSDNFLPKNDKSCSDHSRVQDDNVGEISPSNTVSCRTAHTLLSRASPTVGAVPSSYKVPSSAANTKENSFPNNEEGMKFEQDSGSRFIETVINHCSTSDSVEKNVPASPHVQQGHSSRRIQESDEHTIGSFDQLGDEDTGDANDFSNTCSTVLSLEGGEKVTPCTIHKASGHDDVSKQNLSIEEASTDLQADMLKCLPEESSCTGLLSGQVDISKGIEETAEKETWAIVPYVNTVLALNLHSDPNRVSETEGGSL